MLEVREERELERIPIMLQHALHERRIWRHFGGQPSHELTDAAAKRIPETKSTAKIPPFRTPWESQFNPNGNRSKAPLAKSASELSSDIRAWAAEFQDIHAPPPPQTNNEGDGGLSEPKNPALERTVESSDGTLPVGATGMGVHVYPGGHAYDFEFNSPFHTWLRWKSTR